MEKRVRYTDEPQPYAIHAGPFFSSFVMGKHALSLRSKTATVSAWTARVCTSCNKRPRRALKSADAQ